MGKMVLVTGGAKSGKSAFAEKALESKEAVCYLATGMTYSEDAEWQEKVRLHRERRPKSWDTHEGFEDLGKFISSQSYSYYLLDCVTMLTTNLFFKLMAEHFSDKMDLDDRHFLTKEEQRRMSEMIHKELRVLLTAIKSSEATVYLVTNEVGLGIVPENRLGRYFRDLLGNINQEIAKEASEVFVLFCGLAQRLK